MEFLSRLIQSCCCGCCTNEQTTKQHLTLSVTADKKFFLDKEEIAFSDLERVLLEKMASETDKTVIVRIPFDMQVQSLIDVLQIGVKNNLKFVIATKAS